MASTVTVIYSNFEWTLGALTPVPFFSIVWYSLSITFVLYSANCRHFSLDSNVTQQFIFFYYSTG